MWTLFTQWKRISAHSYGYAQRFFCINTFTFILTRVQIEFKGLSRKIGRLLSKKLSNVSLKFEIS